MLHMFGSLLLIFNQVHLLELTPLYQELGWVRKNLLMAALVVKNHDKYVRNWIKKLEHKGKPPRTCRQTDLANTESWIERRNTYGVYYTGTSDSHFVSSRVHSDKVRKAGGFSRAIRL
jgi:hypothetical protein